MNFYMAKVSVRQCMADIRINDVPVLRKNVEGDLMVQVPINYLIETSGQQTLTIRVSPILGDISLRQGALCSVEVWRYDGSGHIIAPKGQACSLELIVGESDMMSPYKYDISRFYADVSYQIIRWSDCEEIDDSRKISSPVAEFYQEFGQLLANKQYDQYMKLVRNREVNVCTALSLDEEETNKRNQILFNCLDNGFVLQPMKGGKLQFYANKRVVTVLNKDMKSILRFLNEETGEVLAIELLLGIKKGQKKLCVI